MPLYEINHTFPIPAAAQEALVERITYIHARQFTTASLLVNVVFKDVSKAVMWVNGKRRNTNTILAHVRPEGRSRASYDRLCTDITAAWESILPGPDEELRGIFVMGSIVAGSEVGFPLPAAGEDLNWLKSNLPAFKKKADDGDEDFVDLVRELGEREDLGCRGLV